MINQQLLDFIKSQLSQGLTKEKISSELLANGWNARDIEEGFNEISGKDISPKTGYGEIKSILKKEILFIPLLIISGFILSIVIVFFLSLMIKSGGDLGDLLGMAFFLMIIVKIVQFLWTICVLIILIVFIRNIFKANKLKREITNSILKGESFSDNEKFKKYYKILQITNITVIFLAIAIPTYLIYLSKHNTKVKEEQKIESTRIHEGERIRGQLLDFKEWIASTQESFVGYGKTMNEGNCVDSTLGSLFNPGDKFDPKKLIDPDWRNHSIVSTVMSIRHLYVEKEPPLYSGFEFNNMGDAKCFSDQDHYAYQVPNYFEDPYPTFYCVDDIHPGVIKTNKQIKGTNCDDIDINYKPLLIKPQPDKDGYKDSGNIVTGVIDWWGF